LHGKRSKSNNKHTNMKHIYNSFYLILAFVFILAACADSSVTKMSEIGTIPLIPGLSGRGGSMARFTTSQNALYVLTNTKLYVYNITNQEIPILENSIDINPGLETLFTYDTLLFIGSQDGMYVYDISNPHDVVYVSRYWHTTSCDPVVFDGTHAFITLNSAQEICGRYTNELQVLAMQDVQSPMYINSYQMESPKGLGVDGDFLFVCDNNNLLVYSKKNILDLELKKTFPISQAYDVIPYYGNLIVTSKAGILQYSYDTTTLQITHLSSILIEK